VLIYKPGDMLSQEELPESLLPKCLDVLRRLSASERDLIRVGVEIVHELRDPKEDEEEGDLNVSPLWLST
jgi:condensin complex subunit 3